MHNSGIDPLFQATHRKLLQVSRRYYLLNALQGLLQLLFALGALLLGVILVEFLVDLTVPVRIGCWVIMTGLLLYFLVRRVIPPLRRAFFPTEEEIYAISRKIGRNDAAIQDSLINFLQIYRDQGIQSIPAFKNLSLKQLYQKFRDTNFFAIISVAALRKPANRLLVATGALLLLLFIFPTPTSRAMLKVLNPTTSFQKPLPITLHNLSGELTILKNEPVKLRGAYQGVMPHKIWLLVESEALPGDTASIERLEVPLGSGKAFTYDINHVKNSFTYWFEARVEMSAFQNRPARSDRARVIMKERPFIRELQAKLLYPGYTRLPATLLPPNNGEVTALRGTTVELAVEANKKLAGARIVFQDSSNIALTVTENRARGSFKVTRNDQYYLEIVDHDDISNYQPVKYAIFALRDEDPFVEIAKPGQDVDLGEGLTLPLLINLRDDFGFSKLLLKGQHVMAGSSGDTSVFEIPLTWQSLDQNRAISDYSWDLSSFFLIPDDFIEYYGEVFDNDLVSGPKSSRSKSFIIRLPSLIDVLDSAEETLAEQLTDTEDLSRESRELQEKLEEINREMKREEEITWERKQQVQEQIEKQKQALEELQDVQQKLEEVINDLDKQDMLSAETLEKYFELQQMFQELATPELLEAMKDLQKAMENSDMDQLKDAMERFKLSMEEFSERIERTHELFKRVMMEQKMDELNKMAQKLLEEQQEVNEKLQEEPLDDTQQEQLANKERNIEKNTDYLEEKLQKAEKEFEQAMAEIARELQKAREYLQDEQLAEQMQNMQQQIQQGEQQQARQSGQNLEKQLEMLQSMMQQAQQNMLQMQKQELMQAMQKVLQDLLRSSFLQEELQEKSSQTDMASSKVTDIARQQSQLRENTNHIIRQLLEIAQKSFFVSPQMSQSMSSLMQNMEEALQNLANRNPRSASRSQQKAVGNFNEAIMSMQNSMNNMMQSGSGTGFEQFLQQLQQMAGQQGQLNQETLGMFQQQGPNGQPSPGSLARMAAQQEAIRRSLENLNQQMGDRGDVLGRLGELGEEMEKVVDDLKKQRLDPKVIERQERILSRMLDAQKSIREKEYSKKRQAEREKTIMAKSPPALKQELLERENALRKEMLEALKEGYSAEYKEFIKSYYEILSRQSELKP